MDLRLNIQGAAAEDLARSVAAAQAVFARAGSTALLAFSIPHSHAFR